MRNPFRQPEAASPEIEASVRQLLSPLAGKRPSSEATNEARRALQAAASAPTPVHGLGFVRRLALGSAAVFAPLMAVTAVAALTGQEQLSAPLDFVSSAAGQLGVGGNSGDHRQDVEHRDANAGANGQPGWTPPAGSGGGASTLAATSATPSTTPAGGSQTSQGTTNDPHANGKGCDDVNPAVTTHTGTPGGPQGCDVGKSAEHRKNGQNNSQTSQTASADSSETSPTGEKADPHANDKGCDDVNPAVTTHTGTPGGPQGCDVGNSADHRQNGQHGQGGNAAPSSTPAAGPSQAAGSQGSGNHGNGGSGGQGNGKGPKK